MPLNALTLASSQGLIDRPFKQLVSGLTAGSKRRVSSGFAGGFYMQGNYLCNDSLELNAQGVSITETTLTESRTTDLVITARREFALVQEAKTVAGQEPQLFRLYPKASVQGIAWEYAYDDANGYTLKREANRLYIETVKRIGGSTTGNYVSNSPASGQSAVNRTYGQTIGLERKGDAVRIVLMNSDISASANVEGVSVYTTNSAATSIPTGPETVVTFGGVAPTSDSPVVIPAGTAGPSGLAHDRIFSYIRSDWMPISMVERTDGGSGYLLHVRIFSSGGLPRVLLPQTFTSSYATGWLAASGGREFSTWYGTGDLTHTPAWAGATTTTRQFVAPPMIVQVRGTTPILNIGQGFDSQAQGFHAAPGAWTDPTGVEYYGALLAAQKARANGPMFSAANLGSDGMQGSSGHLNIRKWINALDLDAVAFQAWSGNSGYANIERDKALALETIAYARSKNCVPILMSAYPRIDSTASGQSAEQNLLNLNAWIAVQNTLSVNVYNALGNGATPQRLQTAYDSGDGLHRSIAGQDIEGMALLPIVQSVASKML